jgi:hypothetical protein
MLKGFKQSVRRKVIFFQRNRRKKIKALHIDSKQLKEREQYYAALVNEMKKEMQQIACRDICVKSKKEFTDYDILSYNGDCMGKVFKKDGKIYRGVYADSCESFIKLWKTGLLQVLGAHHLIPVTDISEYSLPEYPIILQHQTVSMWPSCLWNDSMIADACILISLIRQIAETVGYTLHDGHLNNVTFHQGKPVFTDIGSIVENHRQKTACSSEIVFSGCYRLLFEQLDNTVLSRNQVYDENNNLIWIAPRYYDELTREYYYCYKAFKRFHFFHSSLTAKSIIRSIFEYHDIRPEYLDLLFKDCTKTKSVPVYAEEEQIIEEIRNLNSDAVSLVDIGGTAGRFAARVADEFSMDIHALEYNKNFSETAYKYLKERDMHVDTLLFHYLYGGSTDIRLLIQADIAVAIDITHNVFVYQHYRVDSLLNSLSKLAKKYVILSYYPYRKAPARYDQICDEHGKESLEEFKRTFEHFFKLLSCKEYKWLKNENEDDICFIFVGQVKHETIA